MPTEHTIKVAKIFKDARQKSGMTQAEVANKAGINPNTYAKLERAEHEPSPESRRRLAVALGIDPAKVL